MPSERQELGNELVRMRRTIRVAIVAAALGATVGAGTVVIVAGAVFSVIDRPASEARKSDGAKSAQSVGLHGLRQRTESDGANAGPTVPVTSGQTSPPETASARLVPAQTAPARQGPCQDQTWPYIESRCLTRADGAPQPLLDQANLPERVPSAVAGGSNATTGIAPSRDGRGDAVPKAIIETRPLATPPQAQGGLASQAQTQLQSTGSAAHETETPVREKERKKAVVSRHDRQKAKLNEQKAEREESRRESPSNREVTWGRNSDDRQADDESGERRPDRAVMQSQSDDVLRPRAGGVRTPLETDGKAVDERATKATRQRKATRPHLPVQDVVEERESKSRDGFFFGGFFGGDPD